MRRRKRNDKVEEEEVEGDEKTQEEFIKGWKGRAQRWFWHVVALFILISWVLICYTTGLLKD